MVEISLLRTFCYNLDECPGKRLQNRTQVRCCYPGYYTRRALLYRILEA